MTLQQPDFVGEVLSKEVCMSLGHSWIICLVFLWGGGNQRKCPVIHSVKPVEFNNGAIMILNHTARTAEN